MSDKLTSGAADEPSGAAGSSAGHPVRPDRKTKVAIVMPCRNEEQYIGRCLDSLLATEYDQELLDIVVVDGMSTDRTRAILADYCGEHACVRMVDNPRKITPAALNVGLAATSAEVVMRVDAHALYPPDYIPKLVRGLFEYSAHNIGGILKTSTEESTWQTAIGVAFTHPFAAGNATHRTGACDTRPREVGTVFPGCFRRNVFEKIGVFNERLVRAQDREFSARMTQHGLKIVLDPSVHCVYFPRRRWIDYARSMLRGGLWVFYARRFTPTKLHSSRNLIPPLFVLWHLAALVCAFLAPALLPLALGPIALYWTLNVVLSAVVALKRRNPRLFPYMLALFPTTHYLYGVGALYGISLVLMRKKQVPS